MLIVPNIKPARILLSAINGYGYYYLKALRDEVPESDAFVAGVVDPEAEKSSHFSWLSEEKIPVFDRIEDYFQSGYSADLTVISSPPQFHVSQAVIAINQGSQVLVDKPVGVTVDSVNELISIKDKTGLSVEVGYQWSFSNAIQNLKQDILTGIYGDPVRFKSICLWPRDNNY